MEESGGSGGGGVTQGSKDERKTEEERNMFSDSGCRSIADKGSLKTKAASSLNLHSSA